MKLRVRLLTRSTSRLNTRDHVRNRSTSDNSPESAYNLSSIRLEPQNKSQSRQPAVAVTVHRSITSDFSGSKSDHTAGLAFEDPKPVWYSHNMLATQIDSHFQVQGGWGTVAGIASPKVNQNYLPSVMHTNFVIVHLHLYFNIPTCWQKQGRWEIWGHIFLELKDPSSHHHRCVGMSERPNHAPWS